MNKLTERQFMPSSFPNSHHCNMEDVILEVRQILDAHRGHSFSLVINYDTEPHRVEKTIFPTRGNTLFINPDYRFFTEIAPLNIYRKVDVRLNRYGLLLAGLYGESLIDSVYKYNFIGQIGSDLYSIERLTVLRHVTDNSHFFNALIIVFLLGTKISEAGAKVPLTAYKPELWGFHDKSHYYRSETTFLQKEAAEYLKSQFTIRQFQTLLLISQGLCPTNDKVLIGEKLGGSSRDGGQSKFEERCRENVKSILRRLREESGVYDRLGINEYAHEEIAQFLKNMKVFDI